MTQSNDNSFVCPHCGSAIQEDDDFCPSCGELLREDIHCEWHSTHPAYGVCIVCTKALCKKCGSKIQGRFLCHDHESLEIYEGMARVFGSSDAVHVEFAKSSLQSAGLHPFIFSRKASSISGGSPDFTMFRASGEYDGHIINEFKLMVPCQEVMDAKTMLHNLKFKT